MTVCAAPQLLAKDQTKLATLGKSVLAMTARLTRNSEHNFDREGRTARILREARTAKHPMDGSRQVFVLLSSEILV